MPSFTVVMTDNNFPDISQSKSLIEEKGGELVVAHCVTEAEVIEVCAKAEALLVTFAPITAEVINALENCKIIVRGGIGTDNVDLAAAKAKGIPVCNVPDYCIDEVAEHSFALALSLARDLSAVDARTRSGGWKAVTERPVYSFRDMTFATAGYGRIARALLERARACNFRLAAYDPFVPREVFEAAGVVPLSQEELFEQADILSLHLPLSPETHHFVNPKRLESMKSNAIVINTARGGLIDTVGLAAALQKGAIAAAGIDVYEVEPMPDTHPLRSCSNALLTSHVAWYSERSLPELQRKATLEILRGVSGEALANQVNK
jgi:D-3-phosphoglycerate dehydrogenase